MFRERKAWRLRIDGRSRTATRLVVIDYKVADKTRMNQSRHCPPPAGSMAMPLRRAQARSQGLTPA
jgi:hypothetical protein